MELINLSIGKQNLLWVIIKMLKERKLTNISLSLFAFSFFSR